MLRLKKACSMAVFALFFMFSFSALADSAFTYQGKLNRDGDPVDGLFDLTFTLYDHQSKGKQITESIFLGEVPVVRGLFTVELDFGQDPGNFNGLTRYLEIAVKRSGTREPTVLLSPRQKINPSPEAQRAGSADRIKPLKYMPDYIVRLDFDLEESQYFHHFNWIGSQTEVIIYREGSENTVRKLSGMTQVPTLELRRFASENSFMWGWIEQVMGGEFYQKDFDVCLLNRNGEMIDKWRLFNAWCNRISYDTDDLLKTVVEKAWITAERIERVDTSPASVLDRWYPGPGPVVILPLFVEMADNDPKLYDEIASAGWDIQVVTYQSGEDLFVHKIPGEIRALDVTFGREVANSDTQLREWRRNIVDRAFDRRNGVVFMWDIYGQEIFNLLFTGAWPAELGIQYDPAKNRIKEELLMACDSVSRQ